MSKRALDQRRRARRVPGLVLEHRQVGHPREPHGPGAAVQRRDHAQLHLALAAERDQPADLARLHPIGGEDHPVDASGERVEGLDLVLGDEAQVHVGEQLELAPDHLGEVAVAEHRGDLGRGQRGARPSARRRAAPERRRAATTKATSAALGPDLAGRGLRQDQRQQSRPRPPPRPRAPAARRPSGGGSRRGRGRRGRSASPTRPRPGSSAKRPEGVGRGRRDDDAGARRRRPGRRARACGGAGRRARTEAWRPDRRSPLSTLTREGPSLTIARRLSRQERK